MKVLILGNVPGELAGARRHLLRSLVERGHDLIVAAPGLFASEARLLIEETGASVDEFPLSRTGLNPIQEWRTYRSLLALMRRHRPDVVLSMTIKPVIYGTLAAARAGVGRRYAHVTGLGYAFTGARSGKRALVGNVVERLYRRALGKSDRVFFENDDDRALFIEKSLVEPDRTMTIDGSGIDLSYFEPQPWPHGHMVFLFMGRLLKAKGLSELVAAIKRVRRDHPDVRLRVAGPLDDNPDGIDGETLDQWIESGAIDYLGSLNDVRPALADAHVFVLPSHREGLPRASMEAMATGRPLITTDAPGCRRTVEEGRNGLLVPVDDAAALEKAMRWMIAHQEEAQAMGRQSIEMVRERFSVEHVNAQLLGAMGL